jgi:hypothetical protein
MQTDSPPIKKQTLESDDEKSPPKYKKQTNKQTNKQTYKQTNKQKATLLIVLCSVTKKIEEKL